MRSWEWRCFWADVVQTHCWAFDGSGMAGEGNGGGVFGRRMRGRGRRWRVSGGLSRASILPEPREVRRHAPGGRSSERMERNIGGATPRRSCHLGEQRSWKWRFYSGKTLLPNLHVELDRAAAMFALTLCAWWRLGKGCGALVVLRSRTSGSFKMPEKVRQSCCGSLWAPLRQGLGLRLG
jgi:hypothetical protein